jgi:hypothetical protein
VRYGAHAGRTTWQSPVFGPDRGRMNIVQITPGAGGMFCGGCFRDNALVAAWRKLGHNALMLPLYLPLTLDEEDQAQGAPIFFGGINVNLDGYTPAPTLPDPPVLGYFARLCKEKGLPSYCWNGTIGGYCGPKGDGTLGLGPSPNGGRTYKYSNFLSQDWQFWEQDERDL